MTRIMVDKWGYCNTEIGMSEMVERVARALAYREGGKMGASSQCRATREFPWTGDGGHLAKYADRHWPEHAETTRAAIEAMRDLSDDQIFKMHKALGEPVLPSVGMPTSFTRYPPITLIRDAHTAMIDAALA